MNNRRVLLMCTILAILLMFPSASLARPIKFAVLSDIHYAVDGKDAKMKMLATGKKILPGILQELNDRSDVDFVVFAGDLFVDPYYPELSELSDVLKENLKKPFFVVPGNHDRSTRKFKESGADVFSLENFVKAFEGHPYTKEKKAFWSFDFNGYHLIGLDSTMWETWGGSIPPDQLRWLRKDLRRNRDKFTVIFMHHPIIEFFSEYGLAKEFFAQNSSELQELVSQNPNVKFVISAHYHVPAVALKQGVHYISTPTIVTYPCKYTIVTADEGNVSIENVAVADKAYIERAKKEMVQEESWRKKFSSDRELVNLYKGFNTYSFEPRD